MSKLEDLLKKAELPWDSHSGLDYTVIMVKSDECTEDASLSAYGQNADQLAQIAVLSVNNIGPCAEALRFMQSSQLSNPRSGRRPTGTPA